MLASNVTLQLYVYVSYVRERKRLLCIICYKCRMGRNEQHIWPGYTMSFQVIKLDCFTANFKAVYYWCVEPFARMHIAPMANCILHMLSAFIIQLGLFESSQWILRCPLWIHVKHGLSFPFYVQPPPPHFQTPYFIFSLGIATMTTTKKPISFTFIVNFSMCVHCPIPLAYFDAWKMPMILLKQASTHPKRCFP